MGRNTCKVFLVGLSFGLVLAGISAAVLWRPVALERADDFPASSLGHSSELGDRVTSRDIAALHTEIDRLKGRRDVTERLATELKRELAALRAQRTQVDQGQEAMSGDLEQKIKQLTEAYLRKADTLAHGQTAEKPPSTPEYEDKRAEAHIQAQVQFMEGTVHMERADPTWARAAEQVLQEVFQREEVGLQLVEAQCRATLCRLALSRNGAISPEESFRHLAHLVPWQGQGFAYIDQGESAEVVVYLAREGYMLPQVTE